MIGYAALYSVPRARTRAQPGPPRAQTVRQCQCHCIASRAAYTALTAKSGAYHALLADICQPCLERQAWCRCTTPTPCNSLRARINLDLHCNIETCQRVQDDGFRARVRTGGPCWQGAHPC